MMPSFLVANEFFWHRGLPIYDSPSALWLPPQADEISSLIDEQKVSLVTLQVFPNGTSVVHQP